MITTVSYTHLLGDMRGIQRYGSFYLPMDEALILCAVDLSGRCTLNWDCLLYTSGHAQRKVRSSGRQSGHRRAAELPLFLSLIHI